MEAVESQNETVGSSSASEISMRFARMSINFSTWSLRRATAGSNDEAMGERLGCDTIVVIKRTHSCRFCLNFCHLIAITISVPLSSKTSFPPQKITYHLAKKMHFSFLLLLVVALTSSMSVSACVTQGQPCTPGSDDECCFILVCVANGLNGTSVCTS